jgi:hypothetical protein
VLFGFFYTLRVHQSARTPTTWSMRLQKTINEERGGIQISLLAAGPALPAVIPAVVAMLPWPVNFQDLVNDRLIL